MAILFVMDRHYKLQTRELFLLKINTKQLDTMAFLLLIMLIVVSKMQSSAAVRYGATKCFFQEIDTRKILELQPLVLQVYARLTENLIEGWVLAI